MKLLPLVTKLQDCINEYCGTYESMSHIRKQTLLLLNTKTKNKLNFDILADEYPNLALRIYQIFHSHDQKIIRNHTDGNNWIKSGKKMIHHTIPKRLPKITFKQRCQTLCLYPKLLKYIIRFH